MIDTLLPKLLAIVLNFAHVAYPVEGEFVKPETPAQEYDRRIVIATAVARAAADSKLFHPEDAAALVSTIFRGESALEYRVHAGQVSHIGTQDGGRAKCLGQVQTWPGNTLLTKEEHEALVGTDLQATERCANAVLRYMEHLAWVCKVRKTKKLWAQSRMKSTEGIQIMSHYASGRCSGYLPRTKKAWKAYDYRVDQYTDTRKILLGEVATPTIPLRPADE